MEDGQITVTSIQKIEFEGISNNMARDFGFNNTLVLMKTAKHGSGSIIYFIRFRYSED